MTEKTFRYTVQGAWPFPTDMLRNDNSHAASLHDEEAIDGLSGEVCGLDGEIRIRLTGDQLPNLEGWESFGWKVVDGGEDVHLKMIAHDSIKRDKARDAQSNDIEMGRLEHDPSRAETCDAAA